MRGCLTLAAGAFFLWLVGAAVTSVLPLGEEPASPSERIYHQNAREMRDYINDKPVPAALTRLLVRRIEVSDLREVPRSCDGASLGSIPQHKDTVATVTDYTIFAIPLQSYGASCSGNAIARGSPSYRSPPAEPDAHRQDNGNLPLPPPPPPVPG